MYKKKYFKLICSLAIPLFLFGGCTHLSTHTEKAEQSEVHSSKSYISGENVVTRLSEDGLYKIELQSKEFPLPINKIHNWTIRVLSPEGEPQENVKIRVYGGMPAHQHDFPTTPRVTDYLGDGYYNVDGVKFSMPGHWEMRFNIKEESKLKRDRVVFNINL